MPKGYNADGSKKVRPANSGRKAKEGKKIHSKLENPVAFIENAIREKAVSGTGKRLTELPDGIQKGTQIDLMDVLEQIKVEKMMS